MSIRGCVIGAGSWGTALAYLMAFRVADVPLWMRNAETAETIRKTRRHPKTLENLELPPAVRPTTDLREALADCELVIFAVPSQAFREVARKAGDFLRGDQSVLSATKGFERGSLARMSEILRQETAVRKIGVLSGPNLAGEIAMGQPASTVVASRFPEVIELATRYMKSEAFRVYGSDDPLGVELAGAMKNVMAVAAGIAHGLGFGSNVLATLLTRGMTEMARMGRAFGANHLTFSGLAGFGDLVCTCGSTMSRNHTVGRMVAQGKTLEQIRQEMTQVAEGVETARSIVELSDRMKVDMPISRGVAEVLYHGRAPKEVLAELMNRPSKDELDNALRE